MSLEQSIRLLVDLANNDDINVSKLENKELPKNVERSLKQWMMGTAWSLENIGEVRHVTYFDDERQYFLVSFFPEDPAAPIARVVLWEDQVIGAVQDYFEE